MKVMNFESVKEKIQSFIEEKKRLLILIALPIMIFLLILTASLLFFGNNERKTANPTDTFTLIDPLSLPDATEENVNYTVEREYKEKWDKNEAALYFHLPEETAKEKLRIQNEKLVNEILERVQ